LKQIFKAIFFISLILSFNFADTIKDGKPILQDQNLTKQVDELCEAIIANDYDKVKAMLDKNSELLYKQIDDNLIPLYLFFDVKYINFDLISLLLEYKPNLKFTIETDDMVLSPLSIILFAKEKDEKVLNLTKKLISNGCDDNKTLKLYGENTSNMALALRTGNDKTFAFYLSNSSNVANVINESANIWIRTLEHENIIKDMKIIDNNKLDAYLLSKADVINSYIATVGYILIHNDISNFNKNEIKKAIDVFEILGANKLVIKLKEIYKNIKG
jgi:hypothetical protein